MDTWYRLIKTILRIYLTACVRRIHVVGEDNLLPGPKILAANHPNFNDGFALPFVISEKLHFLMQSEVYNLPIFGFLFSKADQIPVVKGRGREAIEVALKRLAEGKVVVIFPEGKLNHGGELNRGRSGAAVLAQRSGAPIIPIGLYTPPENVKTLRGWGNGRSVKAKIQVRGDCYIHIGKPYISTRSSKGVLEVERLHQMMEKLMTQIALLVEQAKQHAGKKRCNSTMAACTDTRSMSI